jgi:hypothetical protein
LQITTTKGKKKCVVQELFCQAGKLFSAEIGQFYSKNLSRATFFDFWVTQMVDMFFSYLLMKQI